MFYFYPSTIINTYTNFSILICPKNLHSDINLVSASPPLTLFLITDLLAPQAIINAVENKTNINDLFIQQLLHNMAQMSIKLYYLKYNK